MLIREDEAFDSNYTRHSAVSHDDLDTSRVRLQC